jgi:predicted ABC-type exoprotein transport system permease subunit
MSIKTVVLVIYLVLGFFVAQDHNYLNHLDSLGRILSALLAVVLWPLVVLGVDLQLGRDFIDIGRDGKG